MEKANSRKISFEAMDSEDVMEEEIQSYFKKIEELSLQFKDYKLEAYNFLMGALNAAVVKLDKPRHLTGQELSWSIKEYAIDQYGPFAMQVLNYWGINETFDFGIIVYRLIDAALMSKTKDDKVTDFRDVYDFKEEFENNFDYLRELQNADELG